MQLRLCVRNCDIPKSASANSLIVKMSLKVSYRHKIDQSIIIIIFEVIDQSMLMHKRNSSKYQQNWGPTKH